MWSGDLRTRRGFPLYVNFREPMEWWGVGGGSVWAWVGLFIDVLTSIEHTQCVRIVSNKKPQFYSCWLILIPLILKEQFLFNLF